MTVRSPTRRADWRLVARRAGLVLGVPTYAAFVVVAGVAGLSLVGATGALTLLPFEGLELTALAAAALSLSVFRIADGTRGGTIRGCPVEPPR